MFIFKRDIIPHFLISQNIVYFSIVQIVNYHLILNKETIETYLFEITRGYFLQLFGDIYQFPLCLNDS